MILRALQASGDDPAALAAFACSTGLPFEVKDEVEQWIHGDATAWVNDSGAISRHGAQAPAFPASGISAAASGSGGRSSSSSTAASCGSGLADLHYPDGPRKKRAFSARNMAKGVMHFTPKSMQAFGVLIRFVELAAISWVTTTWL